MKQYINALKHILEHGTDVPDRTGVGTKSVFGHQMRFNLAEGFPAVTTKRLAWRAVVSELLWFIEGSGDERRLAEILHGSRDTDRKTIWTANAEADYWKPRAKFDGDLGRVYGVQWRHWQTPVFHTQDTFRDEFGNYYNRQGSFHVQEIDQLQRLIDGVKQDPHSRRHILSAWNPGELNQMALPPCHVMAQFYVSQGKLSCQLYQRSCDMFLGVPFNIASYSLLTHMIAQICNLEVGDFVWTGGDCHIYLNHLEQVSEQIARQPGNIPVLTMPKFTTLNELMNTTVNDYVLVDYHPMPSISAPMAV